ncbi:MAG TPA: RNA polymerase sigma factor [Polyangia bacterium]|jgi:RNA polymerase sigma-70 factor (ECF subfamily)
MLRVDLATAALTSDAGPASAAGAARDFDAVYDAWFDEVSRWTRALGGLEADLDDLTQEVFVVVGRKLPAFDGRNLRAWLYRIAANTVSDWRRRAWFRGLFRRREVVLEDVPSAAPGPAEALERRDAARTLARLLERLSARRRTTFILFEIEGYTGEEIAALEGVSPATVFTRLHHARRDLLRLYADLRRSEGE